MSVGGGKVQPGNPAAGGEIFSHVMWEIACFYFFFLNTFFFTVSSFKNRPHMTFDDVSGAADQEFEVVQDDEGRIQYPTK